jgi:hypothetical protein
MTSNQNSVSPAKADLNPDRPGFTSSFVPVTRHGCSCPRSATQKVCTHLFVNLHSKLCIERPSPLASGEASTPKVRVGLVSPFDRLWIVDFGPWAEPLAAPRRGLSHLTSPRPYRRNVGCRLRPALDQLWTLDVGLWTVPAILASLLSRDISSKKPRIPSKARLSLLRASASLREFMPRSPRSARSGLRAAVQSAIFNLCSSIADPFLAPCRGLLRLTSPPSPGQTVDFQSRPAADPLRTLDVGQRTPLYHPRPSAPSAVNSLPPSSNSDLFGPLAAQFVSIRANSWFLPFADQQTLI